MCLHASVCNDVCPVLQRFQVTSAAIHCARKAKKGGCVGRHQTTWHWTAVNSLVDSPDGFRDPRLLGSPGFGARLILAIRVSNARCAP